MEDLILEQIRLLHFSLYLKETSKEDKKINKKLIEKLLDQLYKKQQPKTNKLCGTKQKSVI